MARAAVRRAAARREAGTPAPADPVLEFMRLMWEVDHELGRLSKRMATSLGVTGPQRLALLFIGRAPGTSAGDLARQLHLDPGTVTVIIRRLEAGGLITRAADRLDTRRARLTLTLRGLAANRRRAGTIESAMREALARVSRQHTEATRVVLIELAAAFRRAEPRS
jgi:DNA-binding MarR family transcriptional regulator